MKNALIIVLVVLAVAPILGFIVNQNTDSPQDFTTYMQQFVPLENGVTSVLVEALTESGLGLENSPLALYASYVFSLVVFFVLCSLVVAPITLLGGVFFGKK